MLHATPLDFLPLWGVFLGALAAMLAGAEAGLRLGQYRQRNLEAEKESTVGVIVAATVGLLAFILAFTFSLAASRFDTRRELLQAEVNAIGTAYLQADFLPGDGGPKVRDLFRQYVDVRLEVHRSPDRLPEVLLKSAELHKALWAEAVKASRHKARDSELVSLFVSSLNSVIDLHATRVTAGLRSRIPMVIWCALILVSMVSMASMGYYAGLTSSRRSVVGLAMILCFVVVMMLIADLDRPAEGALRVNHQGMIELRESMTAASPEGQGPAQQ